MASLLLVGTVFFATQNRTIDPQRFSLLVHPDSRAMAWIRENTPENSKFLVEGFAIYDQTTVVGADSGWWIPLLTGRKNSMPPQYPLISESADPPSYSQDVVNLVNRIEASGISSDLALEAICEQGITHLFIGQRQGRVGDAPQQLFSEEEVLNGPAFHLVYAQDRVRIFELDSGSCE